jgi:hypothetical protein
MNSKGFPYVSLTHLKSLCDVFNIKKKHISILAVLRNLNLKSAQQSTGTCCTFQDTGLSQPKSGAK